MTTNTSYASLLIDEKVTMLELDLAMPVSALL